MRGIGLLGVVLIVLGVATLIFGHFTYSQTKPVADIGPVHINSQEEHHVSIPTVAGIVIVIAGLGLVLVGRRST
jgi:UDP-N-acetylmuramyl pentapeptide phosphotransferase/UDP-N-acetylglucosamine-1-phosphate transferase